MWQDLIMIQQTVNRLEEQPEYDKDANIGITGDGSADSGKFVMPLSNHPNLPSPTTITNLELATGRSDAHTVEHVQTASEAPTFTLEMPANAHNVSLFLWSLFQSGASESETGGTITMTCIPYVSPVPEVWLAVTRLMIAVSNTITMDTVSHMVYGCICRSLTLTSEEGGLMNLSAEIVVGGHRIYNRVTQSATNMPRVNYYPNLTTGDTLYYTNTSNVLTFSGKTSTFTAPGSLGATTVEVATTAFTDGSTDELIKAGDMNFPTARVGDEIIVRPNTSGNSEAWSTHDAFDTTAYLKYQNAQISLGTDTTSANLTPVNLPGFSITITNNAEPHFYNSPIPYKYTLGKLEVTGSFFLPWGTATEGANLALSDYKAGNDTSMQIYWGTASASNPLDFSIEINMIKDDVVIEGDTELGSQTNFKLVSDGTYGLSIKTAYNSDTLDRGL